jgi:hypothetical protein
MLSDMNRSTQLLLLGLAVGGGYVLYRQYKLTQKVDLLLGFIDVPQRQQGPPQQFQQGPSQPGAPPGPPPVDEFAPSPTYPPQQPAAGQREYYPPPRMEQMMQAAPPPGPLGNGRKGRPREEDNPAGAFSVEESLEDSLAFDGGNLISRR